MDRDHEAAIRSAVEALVAALMAAVRDTSDRQPIAERLLSIDETAAVLGLGRTYVYEQIGTGRLRSLKCGKRRMVAESAVREYTVARAEQQ